MLLNLLLIMESHNPFVVVAVITLCSSVIVALVYFLSMLFTGGRGMLYDFVQRYGFDSPITIDMLKNIIKDELSDNGYNCGFISLGHEVGNRFNGNFYTSDGEYHEIVIITDGWTLSYSIDGGAMRMLN